MRSLLLLFVFTCSVMGEGFGVTIPIGTNKTQYTYSSSKGIEDYSKETYFAPSIGIGIAYDSNLHRDEYFSYRTSLEYAHLNVSGSDITNATEDVEEIQRFNKYSFVNAINLRILDFKSINLNLGARLYLEYIKGERVHYPKQSRQLI